MANKKDESPMQQETQEWRTAFAERQYERYRHAFLQLLQERFTDLDSTLMRLLEVLATTLDVDRVGLWMFDDREATIHCAHQYQRRAPRGSTPTTLSKKDYPVYFSAISQQLTVAISDVSSNPNTRELIHDYLMPLGITAMLDVPVRAFGRYIGILCHEHAEGVRDWTSEDQAFAAGVATQVALTFERDRARQTQAKLLLRSLYDQDTQLPNRLHFENEVTDRIEAATPIAIAVAHIDQYKRVAQIFGQQQSTALLRLAVKRLQERLPDKALLARTAEDEFSVLLDHVEAEKLTANTSTWATALRSPLVVDGENVFLTLSIGTAASSAHSKSNAEQLISDAGLAMTHAKQEGGARVVKFANSMRQQLESRVQIEQDLRRGMAAREFSVHFQPIMDLRTLRCVGAEALLRWQHPTRGLLYPDEFISVALESGAMLELGRQALRGACEGLARMRSQTQDPTLTVSINMSGPELLAPGMADLTYAELNRVGLFPDAITIEVTEAALLTDLDHASSVLESFKASGIHVSLDDFGTAFSSLSWLHKLPIDNVKIDRGFVEGIPTNPRSTTMVRAIAELSRSFNRSVIAEGIETEQQLHSVREMGISFGQGYLFSRAEPVERCTRDWLSIIQKS